LSELKVYVTNHIHSRTVCGAFAEGCGGVITPPGRLLNGTAAVYGILRGCGEIIRRCGWIGRDYYHIDHGYVGRGHYDGYYRISRNGLQCDLTNYLDDIASPQRWEDLKTELRPWRRNGKKILVAPVSEAVGRLLSIDVSKWLDVVIAEIKNHTERPVEIKRKHDGAIEDVLDDCWCLVSHASNAAVDALIAGVPVIVLRRSAVKPLAWEFTDLEDGKWPHREPVFWQLAHHQFTLDQSRSLLHDQTSLPSRETTDQCRPHRRSPVPSP